MHLMHFPFIHVDRALGHPVSPCILRYKHKKTRHHVVGCHDGRGLERGLILIWICLGDVFSQFTHEIICNRFGNMYIPCAVSLMI